MRITHPFVAKNLDTFSIRGRITGKPGLFRLGSDYSTKLFCVDLARGFGSSKTWVATKTRQK